MRKLMVIGVFVVGLAGCVDMAAQSQRVGSVAKRKTGIHYAYSNVRIDKLFGLNEDVLSDTNLFPRVSSPWHHYELELDKTDGWFGRCTAHLERDAQTGRLELDYIELSRSLDPGSDDAELLSECRKTLHWLNDRLGTDMELEKLTDLETMKSGRIGGRASLSITLCDTSVHADLAGGQQICMRASDAVFMKRGNEYVEMAPPSIDVCVRVGKEDCQRRKCLGRCRPTKTEGTAEFADSKPEDVLSVSFGADLSKALSKKVKEREKEGPRRIRSFSK